MEKRALVTGATGFIGSNLVRALLKENWIVQIIAREHSKLDLLDDIKNQITVALYNGTVTSITDAMSSFKPDVVFHLASLFITEHKPEDVEQLIESNILFSTYLLEAMNHSQVKYIINTGTSWEHYNNEQYNPVNLYAATKQAFESILTYYVKSSNIKSITLKLYDTYGPGDPRPKLLSLLKTSVKTNNQLGLSGGEQILNLVHIDDVVSAFLAGADRLLLGKVEEFESYAVSAKEVLSLKELVQLIECRINQSLPIVWGVRPYRTREVMTPWSTGRSLPDWEPQMKLSEGILQYFRS